MDACKITALVENAGLARYGSVEKIWIAARLLGRWCPEAKWWALWNDLRPPGCTIAQDLRQTIAGRAADGGGGMDGWMDG